MRKLDVFNHFFPERYFRQMIEVAPGHKDMGKRVRNIPALRDLDVLSSSALEAASVQIRTQFAAGTFPDTLSKIRSPA